jgi:hypothetical protein
MRGFFSEGGGKTASYGEKGIRSKSASYGEKGNKQQKSRLSPKE